jgi:hypothetical protein
VPVLSAFGGLAILGESPGPFILAGVAVTAAGVALSSGLFNRRC